MATSFTVPHTASDPMSPPRKNSGETTCASVLTTSLACPCVEITEPSLPARKLGLSHGFMKALVIKSCIILPPLPWPTVILSWWGSGTGQLSPSMVGLTISLISFTDVRILVSGQRVSPPALAEYASGVDARMRISSRLLRPLLIASHERAPRDDG